MEKFIGRERELSLIKEILGKKSAAVMIYGKRKVGKTTLIKHALESAGAEFVYYECLKSSVSDNVTNFVRELVRAGVIPLALPFSQFTDVFAYLSTLNKTLNIVIDEYPYLKSMTTPEIIDSQFQNIIDQHIGNIRLFLSGSHIGLMRDLLTEKNALYGRFSLTIQLKELDYAEASEFYPDKSVYDKVAFYAVFGGSPFVNGFIDPDKAIKDNVITTILNPNSPVSTYAEHLLISDYSNAVNAERILFAISNGRKKYGEIEEMLDMRNNGLLSKQLSALLDMDIVEKNYPINRPDDKKKISYEVCDNLLRFYYSFVYKNKSALSMLGAEAFYDEYVEKPMITFISHRFEEICRTYFSRLSINGKLKGVLNIGTYYYDDSATRTNGEFDVVLKRRNAYDIYEVKFYRAPLNEKEILSEAEKIKNVKGLSLGEIGFISVSGYEDYPKGYNLIDGEALYKI